MIRINRENGLIMKGRMAEIDAEVIIILRELLKKKVEILGEEKAGTAMANLMYKVL